jgi:hypothetical protein
MEIIGGGVMLLVQIAALLMFLIGGGAAIRRLPAAWQALTWVAVPALLLPLWLQLGATHHWSWFLWAKTWSVVLACAWFALCAARPGIQRPVVAVTVQLFLGLNILEAVVMDWSRGATANAIAGLVLIASLALIRAPRVEARAGRPEIVFELGWSWIASYTVWNACFVYGSFTHAFGQHLAVLAAALVPAIRRGQASWLTARATSLGLYLVVYDSLFGYFRYGFDTASWKHPAVITGFGWVSLVSALVAAVALTRARLNPSPSAGRVSHVTS